MSFILIYPGASFSFAVPSGIYGGVFGGGGHSSNNSANQTGTAFFPAARGGPLFVNATGNIGGSAWISGAHIGYGWQGESLAERWSLAPAVELEGYYLRSSQNGQLNNPTTRIPEHTFEDSFPMNTGILLANAVLTFKTPYTNKIYPYLGVGAGRAVISVVGANSAQVHPPEPGINHFNANPNASNWASAAQVKAGLRINVTEHWRLLAEYRLLCLSSTNYTFGQTKYVTHVPTTRWNVNLSNMVYNMGGVGVEYSM